MLTLVLSLMSLYFTSFDTATNIYSSSLSNIHEEVSRERRQVIDTYVFSLSEERTKAQQEGNLSLYVSITEQIEKAIKTDSLPKEHALQKDIEKAEANATKKKERLRAQYIRALKGVVRDETKKGNIKTALKAKEILDALSDKPVKPPQKNKPKEENHIVYHLKETDKPFRVKDEDKLTLTNGMTIACWFRSDLEKSTKLVDKSENRRPEYQLYVTPNGELAFAIADRSYWAKVIVSKPIVRKWKKGHAAVVWDKDITLYFNGERVAVGFYDGEIPNRTSDLVFAHGTRIEVSDCYIMSKAMTEKEIQTLMKKGAK